MAKRKGTATVEDFGYIIAPLRANAVPIDSITPDPCNPNSHNEASVAAIAASLREFDQRKPLIVNERTKIILSGNGTHAAAKSLGWSHVAAFFVPDDPIKNARWSIVDNRAAEFSEWDVDHLNTIKGGLAEARAWDDLADAFALDDLLPAADDPAGEAAPSEPIPERYQIVVTVPDQQSQEDLFRELHERGYKCRPLTT
jgi:hypothetical protein